MGRFIAIVTLLVTWLVKIALTAGLGQPAPALLAPKDLEQRQVAPTTASPTISIPQSE